MKQTIEQYSGVVIAFIVLILIIGITTAVVVLVGKDTQTQVTDMNKVVNEQISGIALELETTN